MTRPGIFLPLLLLVVALVLALDLRTRQFPIYDEGITLLNIAGSQGRYALLEGTEGGLGAWRDAAHWKAYASCSGAPEPGTIMRDLNLHDVHPPLFFWLAGIACRLPGDSVSGVVVLNYLLFALAIGLFLAVLRLRFAPREAALCTGFLALAPITLGVAPSLRQYDLLMCAVLLLVLVLSRALVAPRQAGTGMVPGVFVAALIGIATHFQFAVVLAVAGLALLACAPPRMVARYALACLAGVASLPVLNPGTLTALTRQELQLQQGGGDEVGLRAAWVVKVLGQFIGEPGVAGCAIMGLLALVALVTFVRIRTGRAAAGGPEAGSARALDMFWLSLGVLSLCAILAQYLALMSPRHAFGGRYFLIAAPQVFLMLSVLVSRYAGPRAAGIVVVFLLLHSAGLWVEETRERRSQADFVARLRAASHLYLANSDRGIVAPYFSILREGQRVLVADRDPATDDMSVALSELGAGDVVVLALGASLDEVGAARQRRALAQRFELEELGRDAVRLLSGRPAG